MPREHLAHLQGERLRQQVAYVWDRSPWQQHRLREAGIEPRDVRTIEDIRHLPLLTKSELLDNQARRDGLGEHVCASREEIVWQPSTSGTTGRPLLVPRTQRDIETWDELNARAFTTTGIGRTDTFQNILNYHWGYGAIALHTGAQRAGATVINAGAGNTDKQLWSLRSLGVTALHASPSYLLHLGHRLADEGWSEALNLRTIIGGGEVGLGSADGKQKIRELFPTVTRVSDVGGATDTGTMIWAECSAEAGGHLAEDAVFWEVLDPTSLEPVGPGEVGELVLTDLVSTGAPLLRYRIRDMVRIDTSPCACGRTTARLVGGVLGRSDDMITLRTSNIYPAALDALLMSITSPSIVNYQLVISRPRDLDHAVLRLEFDTDLGGDALHLALARVSTAFHAAFSSRVEIDHVPRGSLPVFAGKAMRIIDRRKGQQESDAEAKARREPA